MWVKMNLSMGTDGKYSNDFLMLATPIQEWFFGSISGVKVAYKMLKKSAF